MRGVGPFDGDTIVVCILLPEGESIPAHSHHGSCFRVQIATGSIHSEATHVGSLDGPSDAMSNGVDDLDVEVCLSS